MKYEGNKQDLVRFVAERLTGEFYIVKFENNSYDLSGKGKFIYTSIKKATKAIEFVIFCNFCQGHYWHKGKNNTFEKEQGWMRNSGKVETSKNEFKQMAKDLTKQLLADKLFIIEKINL